jgi:2-polyprenyl-3-methyl-5-hydroxy-6-metoxy-1,4-benzoquinol methylase
MTSTTEYWESVYQTKAVAEVSWHQDEPTMSMTLIKSVAGGVGDVVDIGGGSSALAAQLAISGFTVTVLDLSATAIELAQRRCGDSSAPIRWLVGDVTEIANLGHFDIWHDRAVFHFLTDNRDRAAYVSLLENSLRPGGHAVIATFAPDGPARCSGLPVQRYDVKALVNALGNKFTLLESHLETHRTPSGKPQTFQYVVLRRL